MVDDTVIDGQFGDRHAPLFGRRGEQHRARLGPGLAQLHPGIGHGRAAAGPLNGAEGEVGIALGISRCALDPNPRPVGIEFFGDDGGDAGVGALPHFDMFGDHGHAVIRTDAQEGVGCKKRAGRRRGYRARAPRRASPFEPDGERHRRGRPGAFEKGATRRPGRHESEGLMGHWLRLD